ncbi:hypothetical protein C0995_010762 [Termitomyces sp. Mi166|nr:hypothetical protein C0995_010762 [Termitomyces sp. Mi166\
MLSLLLLSLFLAVLHSILLLTKGYDLVEDYSGTTFFDDWDFYGGYDNLTLGDVVWLDRDQAYGQGLVYVNTVGNAILKVDNEHSVAFNQKRASVRIASKASYAVGSLWITDMVHIPYGCSVWPAFWTTGPTWPNDGEIDIMEGINLMDHNGMALHTLPGCMHLTPPNQMGHSEELDCSTPTGCVVAETKPNSYQAGFAAAGGGAFAAQFDVAGIFIWFWSRPDIPLSIMKAASSKLPVDMSDWGPPSASFPATTCNITQFFGPQKLVLDITLCGSWAAIPEFYLPTCGNSGPTGICYNDNVVGPGDGFNNAYFEIRYVHAYTTGGIAPTPTAAAVAVASPKTTSTQTPIGTQLAPSSLFYPDGAVGSYMERGAGTGLLSMLAGAVVVCLVCF